MVIKSSGWKDNNQELIQSNSTSYPWHQTGKEQKQYMDRVKRIWYLSPMRAAKVQASLRIRAVSPEPSLLAHTSSESRGTFRQKARSLAPLNDWACAVKICHDGMLEDTNSLDGAHIEYKSTSGSSFPADGHQAILNKMKKISNTNRKRMKNDNYNKPQQQYRLGTVRNKLLMWCGVVVVIVGGCCVQAGFTCTQSSPWVLLWFPHKHRRYSVRVKDY